MAYKIENNKVIIEIDFGGEEYLLEAIKSLLFCLRNQDQEGLSYQDMQMSLWFIEQLLPSLEQLNLSKKTR